MALTGELLSKKSILVVEDDEVLRQVITTVLLGEGFEVHQAENGLVAKMALDKAPNFYSLVISDVKMPEMDGVTLLKYSKAKYPNIKFLVTTGFSEVLEAKDAYKLGVDEFLAKPFKASNLLEAISNIFSQKDEGHHVIEDDEYSFCRISVDDFTSTTRLPSDIYIRLTATKFIKVARENSEIEVSRIQTYKQKKVDYFYVKTEQFHKYSGLTLRLARIVSENDKIPREKKAKLLKHTSEVLLNQVFIEGISQEMLTTAKDVLNNTISVISTEPELFNLLELMQSHEDSLYAHSVAVSTYSCLVAKELGWTSAGTISKLSLGGLFHDIGKKEIPPHILKKHRREMNNQEVMLYESHAIRGRDILNDMPGFPNDVIHIVLQHHENCSGTGYPYALKAAKIHPLAKVIHLTNLFCHQVMRGGVKTNESAHKVLFDLYENKGQEIDPMVMRALMLVFNCPLPDALKKVRVA